MKKYIIILFLALAGCTETEPREGANETEQALSEEIKKTDCDRWHYGVDICFQLHKQNLILERIATALEKNK